MLKLVTSIVVLFHIGAVLGNHIVSKDAYPVWADAFGGAGNDTGLGVAVDSQYNSIYTGAFEDTLTVGGTVLTSKGDEDIFVFKLDWEGRPIWARSFGSLGADVGKGIAVDKDDYIYITGYYSDDIYFGKYKLKAHEDTPSIFVIKLSCDGDIIWAKGFGCKLPSMGYGIAVDEYGDEIVVTGSYQGTIIIGSYELTKAGTGSDVFVFELNKDGDVCWATSFPSQEDSVGTAVALDKLGNIFVTGYFSGILVVPHHYLESAGLYDIFLIKLEKKKDYKVEWAKRYGGIQGNDYAYSVAVADGGGVYVAGGFGSPQMHVGSTILKNTGDQDIYVFKLDEHGKNQWATSFGSDSYDTAFAIAVNHYGHTVLVGQFSGTLPVGSSYTLDAGTGEDLFVISLDKDGSVLFAKGYGGGDYDTANAVAVDQDDNIYVTGAFDGTILIGDFLLTAQGAGDVLAFKLEVYKYYEPKQHNEPHWMKTYKKKHEQKYYGDYYGEKGEYYGDYEGGYGYEATPPPGYYGPTPPSGYGPTPPPGYGPTPPPGYMGPPPSYPAPGPFYPGPGPYYPEEYAQTLATKKSDARPLPPRQGRRRHHRRA